MKYILSLDTIRLCVCFLVMLLPGTLLLAREFGLYVSGWISALLDLSIIVGLILLFTDIFFLVREKRM